MLDSAEFAGNNKSLICLLTGQECSAIKRKCSEVLIAKIRARNGFSKDVMSASVNMSVGSSFNRFAAGSSGRPSTGGLKSQQGEAVGC